MKLLSQPYGIISLSFSLCLLQGPSFPSEFEQHKSVQLRGEYNPFFPSPPLQTPSHTHTHIQSQTNIQLRKPRQKKKFKLLLTIIKARDIFITSFVRYYTFFYVFRLRGEWCPPIRFGVRPARTLFNYNRSLSRYELFSLYMRALARS